MTLEELNARMAEANRITARNMARNLYGDNALSRYLGPAKPRRWLDCLKDRVGTVFVRFGEWVRGYSESDY